MTIAELKQSIESNTLERINFIFSLTDASSEFISNQYIKSIAENKCLEVKYISDYSEVGTPGFIEDTNLYIYKTDKADTVGTDSNCIVICNKTNNKEAILIPKLENWQFIDYLITKVPGMEKADLEWLITQYETTDSRVTQTNYFRLDNDIDKIAIFDSSCQNQIFNQLYDEGEYNTISNLTIFDLTNALLHKDINLAKQVLKVFDYIDSRPSVWLLSILIKGVRNVIGIQTGINVTAAQLGISDKHYYAIKKNNCGYYSLDELINIYETLTNAEYLYKFGGLTQEDLPGYLICKMLESVGGNTNGR